MQQKPPEVWIGSEKHVQKVRDEAWATQHRWLDQSIRTESRDYVRASYLLGEIVHAFFPTHFPEPRGFESLVRDDPDGISRNALRRAKFIEGDMPLFADNERFSRDKQAIREKLKRIGISEEAIDTGIRNNFVYPKDGRELVYVDTLYLGDYSPSTGKFEPTVNVDLLRNKIMRSQFVDELKQNLLKKLEQFQLSVKQFLRAQSDRDRS